MSIARKSLDACIGCQKCVDRCPMDVFYYDAKTNKSVMVYPENCQSCGQCYLACPADSLIMVDTVYEYAPVPIRGLRTFQSVKPKKERPFSGGR